MELKQEELDKVLAGNTQGMSEEAALNNSSLFRTAKIEELIQAKEELKSLNNADKNNENEIAKSK